MKEGTGWPNKVRGSYVDYSGEANTLSWKLQASTVVVLLIYMIHIILSFVLTSLYNASIIGVIFAFLGLLVVIGFIGAYKKDYILICVYIVVLGLELVLGLIGTVLWLVTAVVMYTHAVAAMQSADSSTSFRPVALALSIILVVTLPIAVILNIYSLTKSADLRRILRAEKYARMEELQEVKTRMLIHNLVEQEMHNHKRPRGGGHRRERKKERRTALSREKRSDQEGACSLSPGDAGK